MTLLTRTCAHTCARCERADRELARMRRVVKHVALWSGIPHDRILDRTRRDRDTVAARHAAVWMLTERFPKATYERIARLTGYGERSGPSHAIAYIERRMPHDEHLRAVIDDLREALTELRVAA